MLIRSKAPLRISFGGGGTDVSPYCDENGGIVLNSTINKYAYCSIIPNNREDIIINSLDFDVTEKYSTKEDLIYNGKLDLFKAVLKNMNISKGCEVFLQCDAPPGCGLGTSSAVIVSLLGAITKWKKIRMDQYASAFGGFNFIEFSRDEIVVNPLKIKKNIVNELEYNLLLCYTGNIHVSANIISDQIYNYESKNMNVLEAMEQVKMLAYDLKKELLKGNLNNFGTLLNESWIYKKKMSNKITNPKIDELYEEALKKGALGGKLLGAGGGGYLLIYCPYKNKVTKALVTEYIFLKFSTLILIIAFAKLYKLTLLIILLCNCLAYTISIIIQKS